LALEVQSAPPVAFDPVAPELDVPRAVGAYTELTVVADEAVLHDDGPLVAFDAQSVRAVVTRGQSRYGEVGVVPVEPNATGPIADGSMVYQAAVVDPRDLLANAPLIEAASCSPPVVVRGVARDHLETLDSNEKEAIAPVLVEAGPPYRDVLTLSVHPYLTAAPHRHVDQGSTRSYEHTG